MCSVDVSNSGKDSDVIKSKEVFSRRVVTRGVLMNFSVWGHAAKHGIVFRIRTPEQGIIFVKLCSMAGSLHSANVIKIAWMAILSHF